MKHATLILTALMPLVLGAGEASANLIIGPTAFPIVGGSDTSWGIQFTALQSSTLTGFDYHHNPSSFGNPFAGTISLNDLTTSTTVYSTVYGPNSPAVISLSGLMIGLNAGDSYQLLATSNIVSHANDEVYAYLASNSPALTYAVSDADISVTKGVFSANPGFQETHAWAAFNNLTTSPAASGTFSINSVPEPSSLVSLGIGIACLSAFALRWRKVVAINRALPPGPL